MTLRPRYLGFALILLVIEIGIALYGQGFIRHIVGDFLVTILIYTILRGLLPLSIVRAALVTLFFALGVEALQAIDLLGLLNINETPLTRLTLGHHFDWWDCAAYCSAMVTTLLIERLYRRKFD
ncbi:MAG: ribosomal maturation YjgA family protein [bacterium]